MSNFCDRILKLEKDIHQIIRVKSDKIRTCERESERKCCPYNQNPTRCKSSSRNCSPCSSPTREQKITEPIIPSFLQSPPKETVVQNEDNKTYTFPYKKFLKETRSKKKLIPLISKNRSGKKKKPSTVSKSTSAEKLKNNCDPEACKRVEKITQDLKKELDLMKNQIKQLEDSKKVALETTKGFMESKTADKNSVNQEKKIKKKRGGRSPSIDKEGKKKEEKEMKKQLEEKSTEPDGAQTQNLQNAIIEKDELIESLNQTNFTLLKKLEDKEKEIKNLENLLKSQGSNCQCLMNTVEELKKTLMIQEENCSCLTKTIKEKDAENKMLNDDLKVINADLKQNASKNRRLSKTNEQLEKALQEQTRLSQDLQAQVGELRTFKEKYETEAKSCTKKFSEREFNKLLDHNKELQMKYDDLLRKLKQYEEEEAIRNKSIENELNFLKRSMSESEAALIMEKEELKNLVQELTDIVKQQKKRIEELTDCNCQQEKLLQSKNTIICDKEEQLRRAEKETCALKCRCEEVSRQAELLQRSLEIIEKHSDKISGHVPASTNTERKLCSCRITINNLEEELEDLRLSLETEREKILIKDKVIQDQACTINTLKLKIMEKVDEVKKCNDELRKAAVEIKRLNEELCCLKCDIEREKQDKRSYASDVTNLKCHCKELEDKVQQLEDFLQTPCDCTAAKDMKRQAQLIESLENQIELQQQEHELQCDMLKKEKERALDAAKFATQKLLDTVNDFQKQVETQQRVQKMLTELLHSKDEKIKSAVMQMSNMTVNLAKSQGLLSGDDKSSSSRNNSCSTRKLSWATKCYDKCSCKTLDSSSTGSGYATPEAMHIQEYPTKQGNPKNANLYSKIDEMFEEDAETSLPPFIIEDMPQEKSNYCPVYRKSENIFKNTNKQNIKTTKSSDYYKHDDSPTKVQRNTNRINRTTDDDVDVEIEEIFTKNYVNYSKKRNMYCPPNR